MSFLSDLLRPVLAHEDTPRWVRTVIVWTSPAHYIALLCYAIIIAALLVFVAVTDAFRND